MAVFYDPSDPTILIKCTDCTWWWGLRFDMREAYTCGENHLTEVHGVDARKASGARRVWEHRQRRRAEKQRV